MSNPTSNFGWQMPTPVDLVTDLPADFEVFGQAVDSSLADLKGGTSGQVLSKNSNTDMDFVWVTSDDANAIQNAIVNAKGDIIGASANDTPAITSVGANNQTLVANSAAATGLEWQGTWTAWTPVFKQTGTLTLNVNNSRYQQIGKTVIAWGQFSLSSTGTAASNIQISIPVACKQAGVGGAGTGFFYDASSFNDYPFTTYFDTSSTFLLKPTNAIGAGLWLGSSQFTAAVTTSDQITFTLVYEAA